MKLLVILLSVVSITWALQPVVPVLVPPMRVDLQPPEESRRMSTRNVQQSWITMPIDHFNPQNKDTFQMQFLYNEQFFGGEGSPIFIMVGGEWDILPGWLVTGNMFEMARENQGYQVYTEHRYYGETLPYTRFTPENLRFLNVDQALADLAYFINDMKKQARFAKSKVILYGGSYAGNMVLWFKQRYPHLAEGVIASSGPIKAELNFTGYQKVAHEAFLSEGGEECVETISQGIRDTVDAMQTWIGRQDIERIYRLCEPLDYENRFELGYFAGLIAWGLSGTAQTARPGAIRDICHNFKNNVYGRTPMESVAGYIHSSGHLHPTGCWVIKYDSYLEMYKVIRGNAIAWYYQTCTEYGYFQTTDTGSGTMFEPLTWLSLEFYVDLCKQIFDQRFDEAFVQNAVNRVNLIYGGLEPDVNKTINIHGLIDPWHDLGVYDKDLKEGSPTFAVPRASHCFDMQPWRETDTIMMSNTKMAARRIVKSWLNEDK